MDNDKPIIDTARRELLKLAAATGTVGILTSLGSALTPLLAEAAMPQRRKAGNGALPPEQSKKVDPVTNDLGIVSAAIQLEQKAINTYVGLEKEKIITNKQVIDVARQFAADHMAHRDALIKAATGEFKGTAPKINGLGTFPIPAAILKKELQAVRYALALELIASKIYFDAFKDKLRTSAGRNLVITILPVETQHVGVFRSVLKFVLRDKELPDNDRLVPFALLDQHPTPGVPEGFSWDFEKLS